ncbi:MAG: hypothetical protein K2M46_14380 [Lachnospiraceae bacterium]|nr:hypothetical protein [Lachnospiraceae bacterium]
MTDNTRAREDEMEQEEQGIAMELLGELKTQNKRLASILIAVIILWTGTIGGFIWYLNQYDFSSYSIESQDGGNANFIGNDGDIINGERESDQKDKEEQESKGNGNKEEKEVGK